MTLDKPYHSLEDFLASNMSHVDGVLNDGWGASFPVKGREIEATVLFADITAFSTRTMDLSPAATLVFVQNFSWSCSRRSSDRKTPLLMRSRRLPQ